MFEHKIGYLTFPSPSPSFCLSLFAVVSKLLSIASLPLFDDNNLPDFTEFIGFVVDPLMSCRTSCIHESKFASGRPFCATFLSAAEADVVIVGVTTDVVAKVALFSKFVLKIDRSVSSSEFGSCSFGLVADHSFQNEFTVVVFGVVVVVDVIDAFVVFVVVIARSVVVVLCCVGRLSTGRSPDCRPDQLISIG